MELKYVLEDKHANIKAFKEDGAFSYTWQLDDETSLFVEYLPSSWPALIVGTTRKDLERIRRDVERAGFTIEE